MSGEEWRVDVTRSAVPIIIDTYLCGYAGVDGAALVLTNARHLHGGPGTPHDRIILPLDRIASATVNFRGAPQ